ALLSRTTAVGFGYPPQQTEVRCCNLNCRPPVLRQTKRQWRLSTTSDVKVSSRDVGDQNGLRSGTAGGENCGSLRLRKARRPRVPYRRVPPPCPRRTGATREDDAACEKTKIETALISSGFSTPSKAGIFPCRPLTSDSRIDARSE